MNASPASWQHPNTLDRHAPGPSPSPPIASSSAAPSSRPTSTATAGTQEVFHTIVAGRKSWKTARGGEVVWPPELEAALLEGLEAYVPDDSRETRLLGRFPLRNRFISDYIYNKTGKRRTPKQVGSRLQQLRDTCGGKKLLSLLSPSVRPGAPASNSIYRRSGSSNSDSSDSSTPTSPISPTFASGSTNMPSWGHSLSASSSPSPSQICIDILPEASTSSASASTADVPALPSNAIRLSGPARPLTQIDPTITFTSPFPITFDEQTHSSHRQSAESVFNVMLEGKLVSQDRSPVTLCSTQKDGMYLYRTALVPNYWSKIVKSQDPTRYMINQQIQQTDEYGKPKPLYAATYEFRYPSGAIKPAYRSSPIIASSSAPSSPRSISHFSQPQPHYYSPEYTPSPPPFHGAPGAGSGRGLSAVSSGPVGYGDFDKYAAAVNVTNLYPFDSSMDTSFDTPTCHWDGMMSSSMGTGVYTPTSDSGTSSDYFSMANGSVGFAYGEEDSRSLSSRSNSISPTQPCFPLESMTCYV